MASRWREENYYRYARIHFDLDSHDTYPPPTTTRPDGAQPGQENPPTANQKGQAGTASAETASDAALLAAHSPQPGTPVVLTNAMINTINAEVHTAETTLDAALAAHGRSPPGSRSHRSTPASRSLDTETKLIPTPSASPHTMPRHHGPCPQRPLHPRRRRSPHPDPQGPRRLR